MFTCKAAIFSDCSIPLTIKQWEINSPEFFSLAFFPVSIDRTICYKRIMLFLKVKLKRIESRL